MNASSHARALAVLFAVALMVLLALALFTPFYQTNDDIAMRLLAEGNFVPGDEPLPYLMFINVILGKILSLAYELTGAIPWYDLILGGSMTASSAALMFTWAEPGRRGEFLWALLFSAYFLFPTFVSVQFSLAGLAAAVAGIGLIVRSGLAESEKWSFPLLAGIALFVWGSLIRFEGAVLLGIEGIAMFLPFVPRAVRNAGDRQRWRPSVLAACTALVLTGAGFAANQIAYRQAPGWNDFYEYNLLRSRLGEYITPERLNVTATEELAKEVGWSSNDFALFRNWFFTDPKLFSLSKVRKAERLFYDAANKPTESWRQARKQRGLELGRAFFKETRLALLLMFVFVLAKGFRPKLLLYYAGLVLTLGLLVVAIGLALKAPPQRVFWPMLILAATMLTIAAKRWDRPVHGSVNGTAIVLAIYIVTLMLPPLKKESEDRRRASEMTQSDVDGLLRTGSTMFVLHANSFPYEDFWTPLHSEKARFDFVGLGASARTPPVQDFLAKRGWTDLPWSLCTEPAMVIIAAPNVLPNLVTFVAEHHGIAVTFDPVFRGQRFSAWRCHRRSGGGSLSY